jgi:hypothetical protein
MTPRRLHLVETPESSPEPYTFIGPDYAAIRARDWKRVHELADKRAPFFVPRVERGQP